MEKVKIDFYNIDRLIKTVKENLIDFLSFIDDYVKYKDDIKQYHKDIEYLNTIKEGVEVVTMKEYVELLKRIDEIADGNYEIYNCGTLIEF